ncbi:DUF3857 domain-containing transglutaminase family protein [Pleionea sediminis]|uniref:DUF3857 domain-containing transglutaminase family protein n=1 Tax=Pleionea sediminis TaxID=2569479 RepID=UPI0013DE1CDA|nr:DUF3857 domain-containing transglutaminase family protein [Pleionea sediminis]
MKKIVLFCLIFIHTHGLCETIELKPRPNWVEHIPVDHQAAVPESKIKNGIYYLLADAQFRVTRNNKEYLYSRNVRKIVNPTGVEQSSQISVDYDPSYESIEFHDIKVIRNGQQIDKFSTAKISILQQEKDLDRLIYDGRKTISIILDDIRVNDILSYSFTSKGSNPIFSGITSRSFGLQWSVPLKHRNIRVQWEKEKTLYSKLHNTEEKLQVINKSYGKDYIVSIYDTKPLATDSNVPGWFDKYAFIEFSETKTWRDVINWSLPLFQNAVSEHQSIKNVADDIRSQTENKKEQLALALNYVQDNIRYFGIEMGTNSHAPSPAEETLTRRYGDCKDKTVLLISILKQLNIGASPALVNTYRKHLIEEGLPKVNAFNHVIVKANLDNEDYWLDPTRTYQTGQLSNIYQPNYQRALVITPKATQLENATPKVSVGSYVIKESFFIPEDRTKAVKYQSTSQYKGVDAEIIRSDLASVSLDDTRKSYSDFYKYYYPEISVVEPGLFELQDNGELHTKESYEINNFWKEKSKESKAYGWFYANILSTNLADDSDRNRTDPLAVSFPFDKKQVINITFETNDWEFEPESTVIDNDFFYYKSSVAFEEQTLRLEYHLINKVSYIPSDKLKDYFDALKKVRKDLSYGIFQTIPEANNKKSSEDTLIIKQDEALSVSESSDVSLDSALFVLGIIGIWLILILSSVLLWHRDVTKNPFSGKMLYYPITFSKLLIMQFLTFGIFGIYWFYRNWNYVKQTNHHPIMPIARGIFHAFWYYPLYRHLYEASLSVMGRTKLPSKYWGAVLAFLFLIANIGAGFISFTVLVILFYSLLLWPLVDVINQLNATQSKAIHYNSSWKLRHVLLAICIVPVSLFDLTSQIGLTPSESIIPGDQLLAHDIKYLQRKKVIKPGQKIEYFYSDALLFIRNDGNGFTKDHVFSYWKENDTLHVDTAKFSDIKNMNVQYSNSGLMATVLTITRKDDSEFLLYLSNEAGKDRTFVAELNRLWHQNNALALLKQE